MSNVQPVPVFLRMAISSSVITPSHGGIATLSTGLARLAPNLLTGQRVVPARALELGYRFQYTQLEPALAAILRPPAA